LVAGRAADLEIGDTAGLETCATKGNRRLSQNVRTIPVSERLDGEKKCGKHQFAATHT
jgi:hypothetical protein